MSEARRRAEEFATELSGMFGNGVVSVLLYGSAARGEHRAGVSDLNLLVILDELKVDHLRRAATLVRGWVEEGNPPPLMMSEAEWRGSIDVFPLEYGDMLDAHVLLAGREPFAGLQVGREHLRLQLEHQLRSGKIQLREAFLVSGTSPEEMNRLLLRSLSTFLTLFRGVLRLDGAVPPGGGRAVIEEVSRRAGFDPAPMLEVLAARTGGGALDVTLADPLPAGYLAAVEKAVDWLDRAAPGRGEIA